MSISSVMKEKLKRVLNAKRVAIVGASHEQLSVGIGPLYNLISNSFQGEIYPVNPKYDRVLGHKCYPDFESIGAPLDLVILLLNQHLALEMAEKAARLGVQGVVIVAGGFKEIQAGGVELDGKLRKVAEDYQIPIIGPNTLGFSTFHHGLHGIFWHLDTFPGPVAIISQSGGVGLTMAYSLRSLHCGLSHFIGAGNRSVVDFEDYMDVLLDNPHVKVFCLFMEGVENPRSFFETSRRITRKKPLVVYKAGKNEKVSRATATHTGALTGEYRLYKAMFKQAGIVEVNSAWEGSVVSKALSMVDPPKGTRLCALTFTAGPSIVAMDKLLDAGWEFPDISADAKKTIKTIIGEKTPVDLQNPIDLTGPGFLPHTYSRVLDVLQTEPYDAYFLVWGYNALIRVPIAELEYFVKNTGKPVVFVFLGHQVEVDQQLEVLSEKGICTYLTPEDGALALNALLKRYHMMNRR